MVNWYMVCVIQRLIALELPSCLSSTSFLISSEDYVPMPWPMKCHPSHFFGFISMWTSGAAVILLLPGHAWFIRFRQRWPWSHPLCLSPSLSSQHQCSSTDILWMNHTFRSFRRKLEGLFFPPFKSNETPSICSVTMDNCVKNHVMCLPHWIKQEGNWNKEFMKRCHLLIRCLSTTFTTFFF